ncbi:McrC family protein [Candidatus Poriferisodalis sp.]|uniref:McrC family protein n=1 Tax=Candidatus Poriferisodalis sp. TaxID=3101277 RepID=UPI003B016D94
MSDVATSTGSTAAETATDAGENQHVLLHEWSTDRLRLDDEVARRLGETPWVSVATDREPGWWKASTRQWVGAFTLDDLRIIVRPKIKPENLFFLLEVGLPPEAWQAEAIDYATTDELLPALVSFFARTAETTLARGLFHHYRHEEDDLLALRGRIDFVRQFRRGGVLVPMACSWDDFTADVDENRCLTAAIQLALRVPDVPHDDRRRLRRLLGALDGVAEPTAPTALERLDRIQYTRLNEHYRPALQLARLILANCTLQDQHGDTAASAFMVDMNQLFEQFVTSRLQRELRGRLEVAAQLRPHLDIEERVQIRPDLTLRSHGETVGVADLKYKLTDSDANAAGAAAPLARHGDYYQLLAYTTALGLSEGTLIYCADVNRDEGVGRRDGFLGPDRTVSSATDTAGEQRSAVELDASTITVQHLGTKLHTVAIDLSGSSSDIDAQITALACHLARSAKRSVAS